MKRLLMLRHAEAEPGSPDKDRKLTRKGRADMQHLHRQLLADNLMPQFALASDAQRTQATLHHVTGPDFTGSDSNGVVALSAALYNATAETIIHHVQLIDDQYQTALIVAHNPGIYQAVIDLTRAADLAALHHQLGHNYASGTLTVFECPINHWSELKPGANHPLRVLIPQ